MSLLLTGVFELVVMLATTIDFGSRTDPGALRWMIPGVLRRASRPFHPANMPRAPPFMAVGRSLDNAGTCHDHPFQFAIVRLTALPKLRKPKFRRPR